VRNKIHCKHIILPMTSHRGSLVCLISMYLRKFRYIELGL
jgi:hypothetical protein